MQILTKEQILAAEDLKREVIEAPEWGGSVTLSEMDGASRDEWETVVFNGEGKTVGNWRAHLLSRCIVDETGERMFSAGEVEVLGKKSAKALSRLCRKAMEMNGLKKSSKETEIKN